MDDLSNWYIRRSRRRFWNGEPKRSQTLWFALVQSAARDGAVMPFLTDHLWRNLAGPKRARLGSPCRLAGAVAEPDEALVAEMAEVRRVVDARRTRRGHSRG